MSEKTKFSATPEQITEWKAKHKNGIFLIEIDGYSAIVKAPGRNEISYASTVAKTDPMKFNTAILEKCWLDGDDEIKTDDRLFLGVAAKLDTIIETAEATVKKL